MSKLGVLRYLVMAASRVLFAALEGLGLLDLLELGPVVVLGVNISEISCCFFAGAVGLGGGVVDDGIVFGGGVWWYRYQLLQR